MGTPIEKNTVELEETWSRNVIRGGAWVFALQLATRTLQIARLIILARVLAPSDFGLMGIAMLTMATLETFSQTGFQAALIQKKQGTESYLDVAWTVTIMRGILVFGFLYLIAPYAAIFFNSPQAKPIIQVIGLSILLQACTNIGVIYFRKDLEFHKQFIYQSSGTIAEFLVGVFAVFVLRNVWAFVFGLFAGNLVRLIVSYLIHPYRPHFDFDVRKAKDLFVFGRWILGSSILVFLITQGDDGFVGKYLGATMLGFYQMAYRISNVPTTEITHVISQVTLPAYSKLQENLQRLKQSYLKALHITSFLAFPIAGLIFVLARDCTMIFLGEKWMPIAPAIQLLVLAGLARSIAATTGPIFQAIGKPHIETHWQFVRLMVLAVFVYPLTVRWGLLGTCGAVVLSILTSAIGFSLTAMRITSCTVKEFSGAIVVPFANGAIMACLLYVLRGSSVVGMWEFLALTIGGISLYLAVNHLSERFLNYRTHEAIKGSLIKLG